MKRAIFISALWLVPVQAFNYARLQSCRSLLKPYHIHTRIGNDNKSFTSTRYPQAAIYSQEQTKQGSSWGTRFRTAWNTFFKHVKQPKTQSHTSYAGILKAAAAFSAGAGISMYALHEKHICSAAEILPISWEELKDPVKLGAKIESTPDAERPALAVGMIRYLATYLDSYSWRWALSAAISTYPDIATIIVDFLIQHPIHITQHAHECVPVVEFLMAHNKTVSDPIKNCVMKHKSALSKTAHGPEIIALIETIESQQNAGQLNRVMDQ